jgi:hypothetical protein
LGPPETIPTLRCYLLAQLLLLLQLESRLARQHHHAH